MKSFSKIAEIRDIWEGLYKNNSDMSFYQSFLWNQILEKRFYTRHWTKYYNCSIKYFVCDDQIIAPLVINKTKKEITILGHDESSDYLSFIFKDIKENDVFCFLLNLSSLYTDYTFVFDKVNERTLFFKYLHHYSSVKSIVCSIQEKVCVGISFPQKTLSFYDSLSKSAKQNYRTAKNRIAKDGLEFKIHHQYSTIQNPLAQELLCIYSDRRKDCEKGTSVQQSLKAFIKKILSLLKINKDIDVITCYANTEKVFLAYITINDEIAGYCEGQYSNDPSTITISRVATNTTYYKYSPGQILFVDIIEMLKNDISFFDLTRGDEDYKFRLGGQVHKNFCFCITKINK